MAQTVIHVFMFSFNNRREPLYDVILFMAYGLNQRNGCFINLFDIC